MRPGLRAVTAAAAACLLAVAACVDFVAPEAPAAPPSGWLRVRTTWDADSAVARVDGLMAGFGDPPVPAPLVRLDAVRAEVSPAGADTLAVDGRAPLADSARRVDLVVPFAARTAVSWVTVRVGVVRPDGEPALDGGDLVLPWAGPGVPDERGGWELVVTDADGRRRTLGGSGEPARPLRVPALLLEGMGPPAGAALTLRRTFVSGETLYPLALDLWGHAVWRLAAPTPSTSAAPSPPPTPPSRGPADHP